MGLGVVGLPLNGGVGIGGVAGEVREGGGAVAVTLFVLASPVLAVVLFVLLMRRGSARGDDYCPDPAAHE